MATLRSWITNLAALAQKLWKRVREFMPKSKAPVREVPVTPVEEPIAIPVVDAVPEFHDDPNHPIRWQHRRRMAYIALYSMLVVTAYALGPWIPENRLDNLSDIIEWFYFAMASIVGAYMGFATWSAKTGRLG